MNEVSSVVFPPSLPERREPRRRERRAPPNEAEEDKRELPGSDAARAQGPIAFKDFPIGRNEMLRVQFDDVIGRVAYLAIDVPTGAILREYPTAQAKALVAQFGGAAGLAVDAKM